MGIYHVACATHLFASEVRTNLALFVDDATLLYLLTCNSDFSENIPLSEAGN